MPIHRPEPGAELHRGEATVPRKAATIILLRGGEQALEVLLVRRNPEARFMGGAWVFPGGSVDADEVERSDGDGQTALRSAAIRELREEAGITLTPDAELVAFARWVTPAQVKTRFDTWFYLSESPAGAEPEVDGSEIVDARWLSPAEALAAGESGELFLVFPTIRQLQELSRFTSVELLLEHARGLEVSPIEPRILLDDENPRIVMPGEPGYETS